MAPVAIGAPFLLSLLTWLLLNGLDLDSNRFDRELRALDDFSRFERGFTREVLAARSAYREVMMGWYAWWKRTKFARSIARSSRPERRRERRIEALLQRLIDRKS